MIRIHHVFKDGTTDPTKKVVPAEMVRTMYEIMLRAEADCAKRKKPAAERDDANAAE